MAKCRICGEETYNTIDICDFCILDENAPPDWYRGAAL